MQSNIIIIGKNSFIGQNIISNFKNYNFIEIDLVDTEVCKIDFTKAETVIHLAAIVHQKKTIPEDAYFKINRDLAYGVAKRAKEQGVKQFVFMSTAKVYGESTKKVMCWNEDSDCNPTDAYGRSKFEAERLIQGLGDRKFTVAIVRSPLVYGPGVKANMFSLVKIADKLPIIPLGGIENKRSMVYIGNLVALLKVIISKKVSGIFIAGDRTPYSTTSLVQNISRSLGKKRIIFKLPDFLIWFLKKIKPSYIERLFGSLVLDNKKTNESLKFDPPSTNEDGIYEMVKWYKNLD